MASLKFRVDREVTTPHGQVEGFSLWIGGPTLARVKGAICDDGVTRTAYVTGEPDTWFSIPARVNVGKRSVKGWLGCEEGVYRFHGDCN